MLAAVTALPASQTPEAIPEVPEGVIAMEEGEGRISFSGVVVRDAGEVSFLISARGYPWVEEESAIVTDVRLNNLQLAVAMMNWRLYDDIWFGRTEGEGMEVYVTWDGDIHSAQELVDCDESLGAARLVFFGSPYFDHIALEGTAGDCTICPLFPLEERSIREQFVRESGKAGYQLSTRMPPAGTEVLIILEVVR